MSFKKAFAPIFAFFFFLSFLFSLGLKFEGSKDLKIRGPIHKRENKD